MEKLDPRIRTALISVNPSKENPSWHGAPTALGVLRGVSSELAVWRPHPGADNMREIALHIAFWENSVANRISGARASVGFEQRKTSWSIKQDSLEEKDWKNELRLIKAAHEHLVESVKRFNPALLNKPAGKNTARNAIGYIHGVAEHSLYHTAEMKMIKSMAKNAAIQ